MAHSLDVAAQPSTLTRDVLTTLMPGFQGETMPQWIADAFDSGLLSVCVYGTNVRDRAQLSALGLELRAAAPHALIAIDEEGGEVTRLSYLEGSPYPGAAVMGRINDTGYTEEIGRRVGEEVLASGFNLVLAPDADVNSNPLNPVIGTRSFGATPELASTHVAAWVRGLVGTGAIACPKHFPGHGDTAQDSHLALPVVDATHEVLSQRDLPPFRAAFEAGAQTVMTSHIVLPEIDPTGPATFSPKILQGLLRDELGFDGVIVTDALDMHGASGEIGIPEAAVRALAAGCDLLCLGVDFTAQQFSEVVEHIVSAVAHGRLDAGRVADAAGRVRALAEREAGRAVYGELDAATGLAARATSPDELARIAASFDGTDEARTWRDAHPGAAIIRIETVANMAVGFAPWGPFAAAANPFPGLEHASAAFTARHTIPVDADSDVDAVCDAVASSGALVVGREIHRSQFARAVVDALRERGIPFLVVEMGWPGRDSGYANVSTFGSSALVGSALLTLIEDV